VYVKKSTTKDGDRTVQDWIVSHGGGAVGAASTLMLLPEEDIVVAIIVNLEGTDIQFLTRKLI
jgi:hypothetical protein